MRRYERQWNSVPEEASESLSGDDHEQFGTFDRPTRRITAAYTRGDTSRYAEDADCSPYRIAGFQHGARTPRVGPVASHPGAVGAASCWPVDCTGTNNRQGRESDPSQADCSCAFAFRYGS